MALPDFPIPGIHFFMSGNAFIGSHKGLNYRITPVKANAEENIDSHFEVFTWLGMLSSELSEKDTEATFSLDTDGLDKVKMWLEQQYKAFCDK